LQAVEAERWLWLGSNTALVSEGLLVCYALRGVGGVVSLPLGRLSCVSGLGGRQFLAFLFVLIWSSQSVLSREQCVGWFMYSSFLVLDSESAEPLRTEASIV
jgi:hypothetical protein